MKAKLGVFFLSLLSLISIGCVSMSYSSSMSNGEVKQTICAQGECRTLYGMGRIDYDHNAKTVTVTCRGADPVVFAANQVQSYSCSNGSVVPQ